MGKFLFHGCEQLRALERRTMATAELRASRMNGPAQEWTFLGLGLCVCVALLGIPAPASSAPVDTITGRIANNAEFLQTSDSAPASPFGYFFDIDAYFSKAGDFTSGSVTYPGPASPQTLTPDGNTSIGYGTGYYTSLTTLHSDFPFGTYSLTASGGPAGTQTANISYGADYFSNDVPYVTNFASLVGLNPGDAFNVYFPAQVPNPAATNAWTFLGIWHPSATNAYAYVTDALPADSTYVTVPAGALLPNTSYNFELIYDNRIEGVDSVDGTSTEQLFDMRTEGSFTTGAFPVPEPAVLGMFGFGVLVIGAFWGLRRRAHQRRGLAT